MRVVYDTGVVGTLNEVVISFFPGWFLRMRGAQIFTMTLRGGPPEWFDIRTQKPAGMGEQILANQAWQERLDRQKNDLQHC